MRISWPSGEDGLLDRHFSVLICGLVFGFLTGLLKQLLSLFSKGYINLYNLYNVFLDDFIYLDKYSVFFQCFFKTACAAYYID